MAREHRWIVDLEDLRKSAEKSSNEGKLTLQSQSLAAIAERLELILWALQDIKGIGR